MIWRPENVFKYFFLRTDLKPAIFLFPVYSVSQKSSPLKLFAIFLLRLSVFLQNFANVLPAYIHTGLPILASLSYYLTKWR